jgi:tetratricopeptide (TPR) repeat protein
MPESSLIVTWEPSSPQSVTFAERAAPVLAPAEDKAWGELRREATHLYLNKDLDGAVAMEKRAMALAEQHSPNDPRIAKSLRAISSIYRVTGRGAEAVPLYKRAISILEPQPDSQDLEYCLRDLASLYEELGQPANAEPLRKRLAATK